MNRIRALFRPQATISEMGVARALRLLTLEGVVSNGFSSITTSGLLAAYALALGANNTEIGVLAAIPFLTQPFQILVIGVVDRLGRRKALAATSWFLAQLLWLPIALIPVFLDTPGGGAVALLLAFMVARGTLHAITNMPWQSWIRDLVPQARLGRFFARRIALASVVAMAFGLAAAGFVDAWHGRSSPEDAIFGFTVVILFGALTLGISSPVVMAMMPEPLMAARTSDESSLRSALAAPIKDRNFRHLLRFLFLWGFALNLATPFFAVYMLQRLGLPLTWVIGLNIVSQGSNVLFLRAWGPLVDRVGSKVVLSISASLYLLVIFCWTFTTLPERHALTIPLLIVLHLFAGVAAAGVTLSTGTIGMKLAPKGRAVAYLAVAALATNLGSGLGPLAGGLFADFFSVRSLGLSFTWADPVRSFDFQPLALTGFDFLFVIAFVLGLFTVNALTALREEGEADREVALDALFAPMRRPSSPLSSAPALGFLGQFPYGYLRRTPIPGLDVALGVTAYQIGDLVRASAAAIGLGQRTAAQVASGVTNAVDQSLSSVRIIAATAADRIEVARQTLRGAMHAVGGTALDAGDVAGGAVIGLVRAFEKVDAEPEEYLWGAGYGAVEGAVEAGTDPGDAAREAIRATRGVVDGLGIPGEEAVRRVAAGSLLAADAAGSDVRAIVLNAVAAEGVSIDGDSAHATAKDT